MELTKAAVPAGPLEIGDTVSYRVTAKNEGGGAAEDLVLTDAIPPGTTYLPGSLRVVDGPNAGTKSDARGDDQAYYDAADDKVVFHLGNGASGVSGGSLPNTETLPAGTTVEYRVVISRESGGRQISNTATASYENRLGDTPQPLTSTSNEQITQVKPAADLTVTKAADATTVAVGQTVTYRVAVHNTGPNPATGVSVTDRLPEGLAFLSADGTRGGYDPTTGHWAVGDLDEGATATLVVRAKATRPGRVTNAATVTGQEKDPDITNNTDTVTVCVEPAPSCCDPCSTGA